MTKAANKKSTKAPKNDKVNTKETKMTKKSTPKKETKAPKKFMMMGKYIKLRVASDNFEGMSDEEIIKDVRSMMDEKSKYLDKDPISCLKWYRAQATRKAKELEAAEA